MPPSVLGSSAPTAAGNSTGSPASGARSDASGHNRQDFDALLKSDGASREASATPAATKPGTADSGSTPAGAPRAAGSDATPDSLDPAAETPPPATEKPVANEPGDDTDTAPWPPLGLAGLALAGLETVAVAAAPAANAGASAATRAGPLLQTLPATPAPAPGAPAPPAAATSTATADASPGPIALPLDAEIADDTALPKALTDAIANAGDDTDVPTTTPLLHALHAAAELKAAATASTPFQGDPTATPHVGGDDFDDAISARIGWLADQKIGHATIKVTPHDLGQIEVRLQMDGDKVHASFTSAHADVRHALESSIPRLREMLNEQGFQLGNADVGHQQTAQDGKAGSGNTAQGTSDGDASMTETIVSPAQLMRQRGLVDAYA
ncbi:flagellar hook-length control protein FliK [Stenotrophomonas sp. ISL-67]|uniref:flagellar hook-length control protein FliK n=1 Tax=Stenotrophomonas sp. ISL-67 TaxID=2819171 RepID=UPI001BE58B41|nr:flagellar hook-length control protein FliK [Stenotrophomonas sp. ISL-67]MBT2767476.1 flagellar hook-length control protein FliK [Stenotrophomonas sp. ISL-67]